MPKMNLEEHHANVVVVATQFNPSIVNHQWLDKHKIVPSDDIDPARSIVAPGVVQIFSTTQQFNLLVVPNRLHLEIGEPTDDSQKLVHDTIGKIVETLPETPYTALGINFTWLIEGDTSALQSWEKANLLGNKNPLFDLFQTEDARFGAYLSKNVRDHRLKLKIQPMTLKNKNVDRNVIQFLFNYHRDLTDGQEVSELRESFSRWNELRESSTGIMNLTYKREV